MNTTLRALVNQAERLVRTEAYEEAIALCHAILRRHPRYARAYRILAQAHLGLGEHGTAADLFRRALGVDPEDPVGYAGLGIVFAERGLREEAIWQLERAFELAPGRDGLRRELARLYEERGTPGHVQLTRAALARIYTRGGLWNKATGELRDLVAREPYRLDLRATLARTLWRAGQAEEAARAAQTALDQAPNCLVARLVLGAYWCSEGRDDEGRRLLAGARELDPEGREVGRLLGKAWAELLGPEQGEAAAPELEPEVEEPEEPAIPRAEATEAPDLPLPPEPIELPDEEADGLPPWLEADEATLAEREHIVTLPEESVRALLGSLAEEDIEEEPDLPPLSEPPEAPPEEVEEAPLPADEPAGPEGAQAPPVEKTPRVEETPPASEPAPVEQTPPVREPPRVEETPPASEPPPVERTPSVSEPPPVQQAPPVREPPRVEETPPASEPPPLKQTPPVREPAPAEPTSTPAPFGHDAPSPLLAPSAVWQRRLDAAPEDRNARLMLARALVEDGRLAEALPHYDTLSTQPNYLEQVIADLEAIAKTDTSDRTLRERLGDAYARAGRFQDALRMYHWQPASAHKDDNVAGG